MTAMEAMAAVAPILYIAIVAFTHEMLPSNTSDNQDVRDVLSWIWPVVLLGYVILRLISIVRHATRWWRRRSRLPVARVSRHSRACSCARRSRR